MTRASVWFRGSGRRAFRFLRSSVASLLCATYALLLADQAFALGEQHGRVKGTVTDVQTRKPLVGVGITAKGPALLGEPRSVKTDRRGRYDLGDLPPGPYVLSFSYSGRETLKREVIVTQGVAVPVHVAWSRDDVEVIEVGGHRTMTRPDSTQTGTVLNADTLRKLPTGRSYQSITKNMPGVTGGSNPNIKGGSYNMNRYLVDGLDITDPVSKTFSANMTFDAVSSVDVVTGGAEAEYASLGGVINVQTASGSNAWKVNASLYANHHSLSSSGNFGSQLWEARQPYNEASPGPNQSAQANVNLGGPLIKDKLWINATYELRLHESSSVKGPPLGVPPYNIQHPSYTSVNNLARVKLQFVPAPQHRLTFSTNWSPGSFNNVEGGNTRLGVAENRQDQDGLLAIATWDFLLGPNITTSVRGGLMTNMIELAPQGLLGKIDNTGCQFFSDRNCTWNPNQASHYNLHDQTRWYQGSSHYFDRRGRVQFDPSLQIKSRFHGSHDIKLGIQTQFNWRTNTDYVLGDRMGNVGYEYTDLAPRYTELEAGLCDPQDQTTHGNCFRRTEYTDYDARQQGWGVGLFVQDRWWTPIEWLHVLPGLRFDYGASYDTSGQRVTSLYGFSPRLGLAADITQDGRNILSAYYGRHLETLALSTASGVDRRARRITRVQQWDPATASYSRLVAERGGPEGVEFDPNARPPRADEITLAARRQLVPGLAGTVEYTYKRISNQWTSLEVNRIWDPTGVRVVDWVIPQLRNKEVYRYMTPDESYDVYHGLSFSIAGQPSSSWDIAAFYTLAWSYGSWLDDNPRQQRFLFGYNGEDHRHRLRLMPTYVLGNHLTLGATLTYQSGSPLSKWYYNEFEGSRDNRRSPRGTVPSTPNETKAIAEFREPDTLGVDARITINLLPEDLGQSLNLYVDVFNLLNSRTPTGITSSDIERFGRVSGRQRPRRIQLALNYLY
ncbi:MAG: TonB-dependent receptor [Proteobacteria bacterium]|nr:TonB-dependent receptor [Pseudomonadota bacterium]